MDEDRQITPTTEIKPTVSSTMGVCFYASRELVGQLDTYAGQHGMTRSRTVVKALKAYIRDVGGRRRRMMVMRRRHERGMRWRKRL